jgi:hypothetical protein
MKSRSTHEVMIAALYGRLRTRDKRRDRNGGIDGCLLSGFGWA